MEPDTPNKHIDQNDENDTRRNQYPARTHHFILNFVEKIYQELGSSDYHSKEDIAKVHKLAVPSVKTTLSTAQQYGLLEIKHGTGYRVTPLAIKIFHPENETEKIVNIIDSLNQPEIFHELLRDFNNQVVPSLVGITNIVIRRYKFKNVIAEKIGEIFLDNLKQYNLINQKNILILDNKAKNNIPEPRIELPKEEYAEPVKTNRTIQIAEENGMVDIVIPLKSSSAKAHLLIPEDYTEQDLDRIAKFVEALK